MTLKFQRALAQVPIFQTFFQTYFKVFNHIIYLNYFKKHLLNSCMYQFRMLQMSNKLSLNIPEKQAKYMNVSETRNICYRLIHKSRGIICAYHVTELINKQIIKKN